MPDPLTGYEESSVEEIGAILDAGGSSTASEIYQATLPYSERAVAAVAAKRAGSGSGGSLPSQWTVTDHGALLIAADGGVDPLLEVDAVPDIGGSMVLIGAEGGILLQAQTASDTEGKLDLEPNGSVTLSNGGSADAPNEIILGADGWITFTNNAWLAVSPAGYLNIEAQGSAPADSDVRSGNMVIWFDWTHGAAKLMVKAKDANGTVVTGQIPLS